LPLSAGVSRKRERGEVEVRHLQEGGKKKKKGQKPSALIQTRPSSRPISRAFSLSVIVFLVSKRRRKEEEEKKRKTNPKSLHKRPAS